AKVRELMHKCIAAQGLPDSDATRPLTELAAAAKTQQIAQLWGYLHLDSSPADYDAMVPLLARTVAPLDPKWGPSHARWAAVNALIKRDLHQDIDATAARATVARGVHWQHALNQTL